MISRITLLRKDDRYIKDRISCASLTSPVKAEKISAQRFNETPQSQGFEITQALMPPIPIESLPPSFLGNGASSSKTMP